MGGDIDVISEEMMDKKDRLGMWPSQSHCGVFCLVTELKSSEQIVATSFCSSWPMFSQLQFW